MLGDSHITGKELISSNHIQRLSPENKTQMDTLNSLLLKWPEVG